MIVGTHVGFCITEREESSDEDEPKKRKSKRKATAESTPEQPDSVFEVDEVKQEIVEGLYSCRFLILAQGSKSKQSMGKDCD